MEGNHHRKQRKILNPIFSIAHMRQMGKKAQSVITESSKRLLVPIFYDVAHKVCVRVVTQQIS
jgi:cytochrome P450